MTSLRQIASIQSLRALAALMVVVGHAQSEAFGAALKNGLGFHPLSLLPWGAGVDIFFVISGFIMVVASDRLFATEHGSARFITRRLKRIVPLYWLFTSLYVLIQFAMHKPLGTGNLLASYLFWPRDVYGDGILRPIYSLGWTLNFEMFFYALFAAAIMLPQRAAVAVTSTVLLGGVLFGLAVKLPVGPLSYWTQPIVLEFALGMGIGLAWSEGVRFGRDVATLAFAIALGTLAWDGLGAAYQPVGWITPTDLARFIAWGLPAAGLVAAAALCAPRKHQANWLAGPVVLGDASYALYLVHPFIVLTMIRVWARSGFAQHVGYWPFVLICIALAVAAAIVVHRSFEVPVARLLSARRASSKIEGAEQPRRVEVA